MLSLDGESGIFLREGVDTDLPDEAVLRVKALPSSAIDLHPQRADVDFIAAKT